MNSLSFRLPWNAWYGDEHKEIHHPRNWQIEVAHLPEIKPVQTDAIAREVGRLIAQVANRNPGEIAIAVDDLTRPISYAFFFEQFLKELRLLDPVPKLKIVVGLGTHRPLNRPELEEKIGTAPFQHAFVSVHNHDYHHDVIPVDIEWGKIPIKINRHFMEADFRVIMSAVVPHPFAGFSGGPKMVLPGLSNIEVTRRTHQMALMGFVGKIGNVRENKFRKILDEFMQKIPVDYFVGFLSGEGRECIHIQAGELFSTYYALTDVARKQYTVSLNRETYDVVWLNAYPKDTELLQIDTAFNPVLSAQKPFWNEETIFVVSAACTKGLGVHDLFGPGGKLYRPPREKRLLKNHLILFFLPGIQPDTFQQVFWSGYELHNNVEALLNRISTLLQKPGLDVVVFPVASIQLISEDG